MAFLKNTITLLTASLGAAMLAGPATALPMPTASLDYQGTLDFNLTNGLAVLGTMDAQYRTPPPGDLPYQFNTSLSFGSLSVTPSLTVTTPEFILVPGGQTCLPVIGCFETPDITLPSQIIPLTPTISLTEPVSVYNLTYTSPQIPLGGIFTTDFGTPLLGDALTIDDLVRAQFEAGATSVSETGTVIGPITGSYEYEGVLQPGGDTILGEYMLDLNGPGLLAELEAALLDIFNENSALLSELALEALLASDPCGGLTVGQDACNSLIGGLDSSDLLVTLNSIGNFNSSFSLQKSIIPLIEPGQVPVPATLPLMVLGLALVGMPMARKRLQRSA